MDTSLSSSMSTSLFATQNSDHCFHFSLICGTNFLVCSVPFLPPGPQGSCSPRPQLIPQNILIIFSTTNDPIPKHSHFPGYCDFFPLSHTSFRLLVVGWFVPLMFHPCYPLPLLAVFRLACVQLVHPICPPSLHDLTLTSTLLLVFPPFHFVPIPFCSCSSMGLDHVR